MEPIQTILISVLCSFVVAIIAYIGVLKQINSSIYSNAQFKWDEELRESISIMLTEIYNKLDANNIIASDSMSPLYKENYTKFRLLLDESKENEKVLVEAISGFWEKMVNVNDRHNEYQKMFDNIIKDYRKIVNYEWKKQKRGYS